MKRESKEHQLAPVGTVGERRSQVEEWMEGLSGNRRQFLRGAALLGGLAATSGFSLLPDEASADGTITLKLGTLAPEGSPWYKVLRSMGEQWEKASSGQVKLKIYQGGVSGNEGQILKKMRIGQLHAATFTSTGLVDIDRSALALQIPGVISSYEELDYVLGKMAPMLEKRIEDKGFKVMNWGDAGWIHFFTKTKVDTVDALKNQKMYAWSGDPPATEAFKKAGFKPVTVDSTDVLMSLQTGMMEAFPATPLAALSLQWFGLAKNMINVPWAPMIGATIVSKKTWDQIPAALQPKLLEIARASGEVLKKDVRKLDSDAIEVMKKSGLQIVPPQKTAEWAAFAASFQGLMRGTVVTADALDQVLAHHKDYLAGRK